MAYQIINEGTFSSTKCGCVMCEGPAGTEHMRLRVCKNKHSPVDVAAMDLPPLTLTPSALVVSSIELETPTPVVAGTMLPPVW